MTREQAQRRQAMLDNPQISETVKRAMLRFWQKVDYVKCDCGATRKGKWAGVHSPDCAVFK